MTILTAQDAQQIRLAKKSVNHETYKMLFHTAIQRIKSRCEMNQTKLQYRIPNFILGRPAINTKHAARYVSEKLKIYGYKSAFYSIHGHWYIDADWSIEPVKVHKKPRDIRRAKVVDTSIQSNPQEAIRRMELIKMQLKNSMGRR